MKIKVWQDDLIGGAINVGTAFYFLERRNALLYIVGSAALYCFDKKINEISRNLASTAKKNNNHLRASLIQHVILTARLFSAEYFIRYMLEQPIFNSMNSLGYEGNITKGLSMAILLIAKVSLLTRCRGYSKEEYNQEVPFAHSKIVSSMAIIPYTLALYSLKHEAANYPKIFLICSFSKFLSNSIIAYLTGATTLEIIKNEVTSYKSVAKIALRSAADICYTVIDQSNFKHLSLKCLEISAIASAYNVINSSI